MGNQSRNTVLEFPPPAPEAQSLPVQAAAFHLDPPWRQSRPEPCGSGWISIKASLATTTTVASALLKAGAGTMSMHDLREAIWKIRPWTTSPTISKITHQFKVGFIKATPAGWTLIDPEQAPVILEGFLWGPPSAFRVTEIATHRREAILHILRHFPLGIRLTELVNELRQCEWLHAPTNNENVRADVEALVSAGTIHPCETPGAELNDSIRKMKWALPASQEVVFMDLSCGTAPELNN